MVVNQPAKTLICRSVQNQTAVSWLFATALCFSSSYCFRGTAASVAAVMQLDTRLPPLKAAALLDPALASCSLSLQQQLCL